MFADVDYFFTAPALDTAAPLTLDFFSSTQQFQALRAFAESGAQGGTVGSVGFAARGIQFMGIKALQAVEETMALVTFKVGCAIVFIRLNVIPHPSWRQARND